MFKKRLKKKFASIFSAIAVATVAMGQSVYAADNTYAKNAAEWILDGLWWLILVLALGGIGFAAVKRNLIGALITTVVGALVLVLIKSPETFTTLGTAIKGIIGL